MKVNFLAYNMLWTHKEIPVGFRVLDPSEQFVVHGFSLIIQFVVRSIRRQKIVIV